MGGQPGALLGRGGSMPDVKVSCLVDSRLGVSRTHHKAVGGSLSHLHLDPVSSLIHALYPERQPKSQDIP
jgi:hypothetical protein